ncbi:hypothetical protein BWQ93_14285 [Sphingopyxis sp. QXT-31]|nr:hypothetical protein BWQ93_14285 [Sphingopyxis sp. QXT-31]
MEPILRYFLGFQVAADRAGWLARRLPPTGDMFAQIQPHLHHLTLCTIAETALPHPFLRQRVAAALGGDLPAAATIPFGRIVARDMGVELVTVGSVSAIRTLCESLVARLAAQGIEPLHRKPGLRPHITLGYGACVFDPVPLAWSWTPHNLVLVESHVGHRRHRVLQSWGLPPPAQGLFDFMADELPAIRRAA